MQELISPKHQVAQEWLAVVRKQLTEESVLTLLNAVREGVRAGLKDYTNAVEKLQLQTQSRQARDVRALHQQRLQVLVPALRLLQSYRQQLKKSGSLKHPDALAVHLLSFVSNTPKATITRVVPRNALVWRFNATRPQRIVAAEVLRAFPQVFATLPAALRSRFPSYEDLVAQEYIAQRESMRNRVLTKVEAAGVLEREELTFLRALR